MPSLAPITQSPGLPASQGEAGTASPVRRFGRFQLLALVGKSQRTMLWEVDDPRVGQELLLALPRQRPADSSEADLWHQNARRAARLDHPSLAHVVEVGEHDRWPFIAYDRGGAATLDERLTSSGLPAAQAVAWSIEALEGLAFAHEAGIAHHDLQTPMILLPDQGRARLVGVGVALEPRHDAVQHGALGPRRAAERDVLAFGLLLHHVLSGQPALEQADTTKVIERMPPLGREMVRLPWATAQTIPEALRAIVNRATDRQERQRYRSARTLLRALEGWLAAQDDGGGGPLAHLLERLRSGGLLPAMPGAARHTASLALMERGRNDELAEVVLKDVALTFEMLRLVNSASVRGVMAAGSAPILTMRRAIDMLGLNGVRRAALSLRAWPGALSEAHVPELERAIAQARRAGRMAEWLRPAGYDAEVVHLLALLQNLGRLVARYHFPEEAAQIERLMRPAPATVPGEPDEPGMTEAAASFAVLGVDLDSIGQAIGRQWGLDAGVLQMMQRMPAGTLARAAHGDDELLRQSASCANEVVDVGLLPVAAQAGALHRIAQRYARVLGVSQADLQQLAQGKPPDRLDPVGTRAQARDGST